MPFTFKLSKRLAANARDERGMALALAIIALVVVGAMITGLLFAGTQEQRSGESTRRLQQSFGVAEFGVNNVIATWDPGTYDQRPAYPGDSIAIPNQFATGALPNNAGSYAGYLYRLNPQVYLLDVSGHDTVSGSLGAQGGARQRIGYILRARTLGLTVGGALETQGSDKLSGSASIDGFDQAPPNWTGCGPLQSALPGVRVSQGDTVTASGSATIVGSPPVLVDSTISDSTFSKFGDVTYSQLATQANITLPGGTLTGIDPVVNATGTCDKTQPLNWGDGVNATGACANYLPIIHIAGSVTINGDQGQGILLVDGDLSVQGSFQFFGVVIVRGKLSTAGGGSTEAHFWGTVMAQDSVTLGNNSISGHANVNYSSCALWRVLNKTAVGAPVRSRGFVELYQTQ